MEKVQDGSSIHKNMPSGRKGKNKQRRRRKHNKQLLERTRRSRDVEINSVLEETDVIAHLPNNGSFLQRSTYTARTLEFDTFDGMSGEDDVVLPDCIFTSPAKSLSSSCFSTPIKTSDGDVRKSKRSLSSPSTVFLTPKSMKNEGDQCAFDENSLVLITSTKLVAVDSGNFWYRVIKYTQHLLTTVPNFFSKICSWVKFILTNVKHSSYSVNKTDPIEFSKKTSVKENEEKITDNSSCMKDDIFMEKLNTILAVVTRLEEKHDHLIARVSSLEQCVERLKVQPVASGGAPLPPPPPPPLPPPLSSAFDMATPLAPLEKIPARKSTLSQATPRPSITLQDILSVQLKKTPAPRPIDKTPHLNGSRGPLVSVDMLRAVKLKPSQLRRRSIERPLQSPSAIFKIRSP